MAAYISKELADGVMLGPFPTPPICTMVLDQPLATRPKWETLDRHVIMYLSWPLPPQKSVNGGTPKEFFLGAYRKMYLPSPSDLYDIMRKVGPS